MYNYCVLLVHVHVYFAHQCGLIIFLRRGIELLKDYGRSFSHLIQMYHIAYIACMYIISVSTMYVDVDVC